MGSFSDIMFRRLTNFSDSPVVCYIAKGRQTNGDKAKQTRRRRETNEGRQGTDKTGEADTTTQGDK